MPKVRYIGLEALTAKALAAGIAGVNLSAEALVQAVQGAGVVPVDEGTLRSSIHVAEPAALNGQQITATVATGAEASDYAIPIHEGGWVSGPKAGVRIQNYQDGGPKYLEAPLVAHRPLHKAMLKRAMRAAF